MSKCNICDTPTCPHIDEWIEKTGLELEELKAKLGQLEKKLALYEIKTTYPREGE